MLRAVQADPTGKQRRQVMASLPISKNTKRSSGAAGELVTTTYHYKGQPLVRFTRPAPELAGGAARALAPAGAVALTDEYVTVPEVDGDDTEWASIGRSRR